MRSLDEIKQMMIKRASNLANDFRCLALPYKRGELTKWTLCFFISLISSETLADVFTPTTHYRAMPCAEWWVARWSGGDPSFLMFCLVCGSAVASIIIGIWKKKYRRMFACLLIEFLVLVVMVFLCGRDIGNNLAESLYDKEVVLPPKPFESYEEYLKRVDCIEKHICLKCYVHMQKSWHSQYCPECEPDSTFVCWKCGGVKEKRVLRRKDLAGEFDTAFSVLREKRLLYMDLPHIRIRVCSTTFHPKRF